MTRYVSLAAQIIAFIAAIIGVAIAPNVLETFDLMQITLFASMAILSLSLAFIWGFGGILSFGQTAFFGLGGYAYAIAAIDYGDSTPAIVLAMLVPAAFALVLGYFIFYGRISDVYLGVITLTVTLILFNVINSTSGDQYHLGEAKLGGFNGIPSVPTFNVPLDPSDSLSPEANWWVTGGFLLLVYALLRLILVLPWGRVVIAVRENETRASLLGYDPRFIKLWAFVVGGAFAGLAGALYVNWGAFVGPTIFSLSLSAEIIIWITVGGLGTLLGPVVGCVIIEYLIAKIGSQQTLNSNLVLGAVLIGFVLLLPKGIVPTVRELAVAAFIKLRSQRPTPQIEAHATKPAGAK
jgi:branched-chain amino acid transport system permease protein